MSMKHIVITGSTRGIGYGLAEAFLLRGCSVTVSGRSNQVVKKAVAGLGSKYEAKRVFGLARDVTVPDIKNDPKSGIALKRYSISSRTELRMSLLGW